MASQYRPPELVERERRLAQLLVERRGLAPPIDVRTLVEEQAQVSVERIPAQCDAVAVGVQRPNGQPEIILQAGSPPRRERFTLGHELGHLKLPWHLGTVACHIGFADMEHARLHRATEAEANRFSAELLIPGPWLARLFDESADVEEAVRAIEVADVSAHVASLQVVRVLAPGWVFAVLDDDGTVVMNGASPGTDVRPPRRLEPVPSSFERFSREHFAVRFGARRALWWRLGVNGDVLDAAFDSRRSSDVLRGLTRRHASSSAHAERLFRSINGTTAYAYGQVKNDRLPPGELVNHFASRFAGRDLPADLLADPDLTVYLARRVEELRARTRG